MEFSVLSIYAIASYNQTTEKDVGDYKDKASKHYRDCISQHLKNNR